MRLTLRTLLSYLDDTLEPAQAKIIGAKLAESEQARELVERIKQVTRRRRLTTPTNNGPGGIDPNTIAEYMDNEVTAEKAAEVEQICLASDVHLAEVAACHQILTLVLGEPALVPPSAKQRMYALVKGPEAIHSRKPGKPSKQDMDLSSEIELDEDETLRLGAPPVAGSTRNLLLVVGSGLAAACLLAFAIWMIVRPQGNSIVEPRGQQVAQNDKDDKKDGKKEEKPEPVKEPDRKVPEEVKKPEEKKEPIKVEEFKLPIVEVPPAKFEPLANVKYQPADPKQTTIGQYVPPSAKEPAVLLQTGKDKSGWTVVSAKQGAVSSGRPLMSLPGSKNVVNLESGIELTLWGNLPELTLDPVLAESRATLHVAEGLAGDLTLHRGRLLIRNVKEDRDVMVRVRFEDPTLAKENHFDIVLHGKDATVALERHGELDRDEPFFVKPDDVMRQGPTALVRCFAYAKSANVRCGGDELKVDETSHPLVQWQSRLHQLDAPKQPFLPPWLKGVPPLKSEDDLAVRRHAVQAHDNLAERARAKPIDVALTEYMEQVRKDAMKEAMATKQMSPATFARWRHAIRCYAALDDIETLFSEFTQEATPPFIRWLCSETLYSWLGQERDNDYQLLAVVAKRHPGTPSTKIMELFHRVSTEDARNPQKYQQLIEGLNNNLMAIRVLSHSHLIALDPRGRAIPYDPAASAGIRQAAVDQWSKLIPRGSLPQPPAPMKK